MVGGRTLCGCVRCVVEGCVVKRGANGCPIFLGTCLSKLVSIFFLCTAGLNFADQEGGEISLQGRVLGGH